MKEHSTLSNQDNGTLVVGAVRESALKHMLVLLGALGIDALPPIRALAESLQWTHLGVSAVQAAADTAHVHLQLKDTLGLGSQLQQATTHQ